MTAPAQTRTPVKVYSPSAGPCQKCLATKRTLDRLGVEYVELPLDDPDIQELIADNGYTTAPVVVAGDEHWSDFRHDKLRALK